MRYYWVHSNAYAPNKLKCG